MATPEEIARFKAAFRFNAQEINSGIRWEEPTGCFAFLKTQTSLADVLAALETLQAAPSPENIDAVRDEIAAVPHDKADKYREALDALDLSLTHAMIGDLDAVARQDPSVANLQAVQAEIDKVPDEAMTEELRALAQELADFLPVAQTFEAIDDLKEAAADAPTAANCQAVLIEIRKLPDEYLNEEVMALQTEMHTALLYLSVAELKETADADPSAVNFRAVMNQISRIPDDARTDEILAQYWEMNTALIMLSVNDLKSVADETPSVTNLRAVVDELLRLPADAWTPESTELYWEVYGELCATMLREAEFDDAAVPATPVIEQMPGWKRKNQKVLGDRYSEMSLYSEKVIGEDGEEFIKLDYWGDKIPSADGDASSRDARLIDLPENELALINVAQNTIAGIRESLPKGPFNNYGGLPEEIIEAQQIPIELLRAKGREELADTPMPAWWNGVVDTAAKLASDAVSGRHKDVDPYKLQMACLARATQEVGGGVCSKMAMATTGALTTSLPPGSEIVQLWHKADHEFVIARVPGSRWFVVDPWCHEPMVIPFVDCTFDPSGVRKFIVTKVTEKSDHPYGIDLDSGVNWKAIIRQAMEETAIGSPEMKGVYGQTSNVDGDFDPGFQAVSGDKWG